MSRELRPSVKYIRVYRQPKSRHCINCEILENLLRVNNIEFDSINIFTPETMTDMAMHYVFPIYAPVLQINNNIYNKELWLIGGETLNISEIKKLVDGSRKDWKDIENIETTCDCGVCKI
jgi:hypothetical protein